MKALLVGSICGFLTGVSVALWGGPGWSQIGFGVVAAYVVYSTDMVLTELWRRR